MATVGSNIAVANGTSSANHVHHSSLAASVRLSGRDRAAMQALSRADTILYGAALKRFHRDLARIGHPIDY